jgi:hypothetical protein
LERHFSVALGRRRLLGVEHEREVELKGFVRNACPSLPSQPNVVGGVVEALCG